LDHIERKLFAFVVFLTAYLSALNVYAQNADSLITLARKEAFDKQNYPLAISLVKTAINTQTSNIEAMVFLGRLYTWNKQPDSARHLFNTALKQDPGYIDAIVAYTDLEYWEKNYDTALQVLQQGLSIDSINKDLLLRKAQILYDKKEYKAALGVVDTLLQNDKGNTNARLLAERIRDNVSKNRVGIKYDYIYFDKQFPNPWHYLSLDYTYQSKAGAFTARINYANRFNTNGLQYEAEAYPIISRRFYGYLNVGYSDNIGVFPKWKAGASLYSNLPKAFEAELGIRYLYFNSNTFIYTAYLGKYLGSFLIGARTYLAPSKTNIAENYSGIIRYYYGGIDDYIGLMAGAGISPDDRQTNVQLNNSYKLKTYRVELTARKAIRKLNVLVFNASFINQEYLPKTVGNQIQVGLGYIRRF
jgi:YaiO family outer membrane protein